MQSLFSSACVIHLPFSASFLPSLPFSLFFSLSHLIPILYWRMDFIHGSGSKYFLSFQPQDPLSVQVEGGCKLVPRWFSDLLSLTLSLAGQKALVCLLCVCNIVGFFLSRVLSYAVRWIGFLVTIFFGGFLIINMQCS